MQRRAVGHTNPGIGTRNNLEHVGKVFAAHQWVGCARDIIRSDNFGRDLSHRTCLLVMIDKDREDVPDINLNACVEACRKPGAKCPQPIAHE
jgi:hypothetical protein